MAKALVGLEWEYMCLYFHQDLDLDLRVEVEVEVEVMIRVQVQLEVDWKPAEEKASA